MDFWDEVTLIPTVEQRDELGTPLRVPGPDGPTVQAIVQPSEAQELTGEDQQTLTSYRLMTPPEALASLDAFGFVRWGGVLYEVDGEPFPRGGPEGIHHIEAKLRKAR